MKTERLYLEDPYLTSFRARVTAARLSGGQPAVTLDRTAFYPEGGGQPADEGTLAGARVVDVREVDGEILHLLDGATELIESAERVDRAARPALARDAAEVEGTTRATLAVGAELSGEISWARRFDHMQQHHGQHLLSAAFERVASAETVSFHLGRESCTIDLEGPRVIDADALLLAEREANRLVWSDLPVEARDVSPEEQSRLPLRKEATKGSRIVMVGAEGARSPGTSWSDAGRAMGAGRPVPEGSGVVTAVPCGGTHPRRTGEVGAIAILRSQKWGKGVRVEFACGERVVASLRRASERLAEVAAALRCGPAEAPASAARVVAESLARKKELDRMTLLLAAADADRLARERPEDPVVEELDAPPGEAAAYTRALAQALAVKGRVAILGVRAEGRALLCFARPREAGPGAPDMGRLLREAVALLGGKGGGPAELAQGGGPEAGRLGEALALARAKLAGG